MASTGKSIPELAGEDGRTKQAWYDVIKGRTRTPGLRAHISNIVGINESVLWPETTKEAA